MIILCECHDIAHQIGAVAGENGFSQKYLLVYFIVFSLVFIFVPLSVEPLWSTLVLLIVVFCVLIQKLTEHFLG